MMSCFMLIIRNIEAVIVLKLMEAVKAGASAETTVKVSDEQSAGHVVNSVITE